MTKKLKSILISLCVCVLAVAAYFVTEKILENSSSGPGTSTTVKLTNLSSESIVSIKVELSDGEYYYITEDAKATAAAGSTVYKVTFSGIYKGLDYDKATAKRLYSYASALSAQRDMGDVEEEDYDLFGLDTPQSVVTITLVDGSTETIYVGSTAAGRSGYYCRIDDEELDNVYLISTSVGDSFTKRSNDMRATAVTPESSLEKIQEITWQFNDGALISVVKDFESTVFNPFVNYYVVSPWSMAYPVNADILGALVEGLPTLTIGEFITPKLDGTEAELADYGLDDPWGYYKIVSTDGTVQEVSFGDFSSEDSKANCYMYDHVHEQIYVVSYANAAFLAKYDEIVTTTPYIITASLDHIESVVAEYDGKVVDFVQERYSTGVDDKGNPTYSSVCKLEGIEYDRYVMGLLYRNAIAMRIQNVYKGYEYEDEPLLTLTFTPYDRDVAARKLVFYKINENLCAVEVDGNIDFMASVKDVNDYLKAIQMVKNGETPPYKY